MSSVNTRPYVLSIAGFDPSAGAGVLADVKTFENLNVYGMGVVSALTFQNDKEFEKVEWTSIGQIIDQIKVLNKRFQFGFVKIGLIKDLDVLNELLNHLHISNGSPKIIWDPILKASAGFKFHDCPDKNTLKNICGKLFLITPNVPEVITLTNNVDQLKAAGILSEFTNVLLKGGHHLERVGCDILFQKNSERIEFESGFGTLFSKHGSGCVLSSAITANLAKGFSLTEACAEGKRYITEFLKSNDTLLGFHANPILMTND